MTISRFFVPKVEIACLPRVPTDEVFPLHFFDDTPIFRNSNGCFQIRFDDVLDPDKIHRALAELIALPGGWRKLGGRIRMNNNKMELHAPKEFTPERPAVGYTHTSLKNMSIDDHPLASQLPHETAAPTLHSNPEVVFPLVVDPKAPHCLRDSLQTDAPMLHLSIVSFKDATLVSVVMPHIFGDVMSLMALMESWSLVLAGRASEVQPNLSAFDDGFARAGTDPAFTDKHVFANRQLTGVWLILWIVRYALDMWWWPKQEYRSLFLPAAFMRQLKSDATAALHDTGPKGARGASVPSDPDHAQPFISSADVVFAWLSCMAVGVMLPQSSRRSVMLGFPCDTRDRAPSVFPKDKKGHWMQNAAPPVYCLVPARDFMADKDGSNNNNVARVSQSIRHTVATQGSEAQIHAAALLARTALIRDGMPPIFGDRSQLMITTTNWTKARLFESVDFSPAVVASVSADGAHGRKEKSGAAAAPYHEVGHPVYFHMSEIHPAGEKNKNALSRNMAYMIANPQGSYWVGGKFPPEVWARIERDLKARSATV